MCWRCSSSRVTISLKKNWKRNIADNNPIRFGFKDKSSLVREAIKHYMKELEIQDLKQSADLYAELYDNDPEIQDLTDSALSEWPE